MASAVERREHSRRSGRSRSRSPARDRGSPQRRRSPPSRRERSPVSRGGSPRGRSPVKSRERSPAPRSDSARRRSPVKASSYRERSPHTEKVKERVRSPKHARPPTRSPSPARKRESRSPSPRTKRLRRAQGEREGADGTEGDHRKTTTREERDSGRNRVRDEEKDVSRDRKMEREDSRGSFKDRKLDRDDERDHLRDRRSDRSDASRETRSTRDDERRDSRGRRSDGDDRKGISREQREDHDDRRDARERRTDRDENNGEFGRPSRHGRSVSPEEHRHRGRHESRQSPRSSRSAARGEDTSSISEVASRSGDPDSLVKMNAAADALEAKEKQKPSFELSGKLAEETNRVAGVNLLHSEPPEARKSDIRWRLYVFKGGEPLNEPLYVHRMSSYLFGRERKVADIPTDHPSCSKQHAVLQYRLVEKEQPDGMMSKQVRPYLMDLGSTNGTFINDNRIEPSRYYELFEKDTIKFGNSSREYVLLHENSKD
ncbi:FHA domain-containing protein DDL [Oryza brachyantha]|uniref:FHA domain-containing protein n=1 Tax=Oryza brachyantha TaxID=4533 RepID=J3M9D5_ORYBR|nr:FHA domain-containing protein DDL [Oryza brachyantha]